MKNTSSNCATLFRRPFIGLLLSVCTLTSSYADEITLNPTHPEKYTVVRGDTLWGISGKFLQHPWQWSELWKNNPQIKHPHLIYPNDTIYLTIVNGQPQLNLSRPLAELDSDKPCILKPGEYENGRLRFPVDKNGKVLPCFRESELPQAINIIPHDKIETFLTSPKVVSEEEVENAPYVVGFQEGHLIVGAGEKVYVKNLQTNIANNYTLYRIGETYQSVDNNEILGYEARYIASATLQKEGEPATLVLTKGTHEVRTGDLIMPATETENTLNFFPKPPEKPIEGHIIGVKDRVQLIGLYSVVVIDKGSADGLMIGHELVVYQTGKTVADPVKEREAEIKLPDEIAGKIMVFRAFEHLSYVLVMQANLDIHRLDMVKTQ